MYTLQMRIGFQDWKDAYRDGAISRLKDYADLQNTDYRIVNEAGTVEWEFLRQVPKPLKTSQN